MQMEAEPRSVSEIERDRDRVGQGAFKEELRCSCFDDLLHYLSRVVG